MNAVATLYRSTIGKKIVMATTGVIMVGWLLMHMLGNLQVFLGPEWLDAYGHKIQSLGPVLWVMRIGLIGVVGLHIWSAVSLTRTNAAARPVAYQGGRKNQRTSIAALTMRYGGIVLLAFIVWHIADLTVGAVHPDFKYGEVYHNLVTSLSNPFVGTFYVLANIFLALHLHHGVQSAVQTIGGNHPKYNDFRKKSSAFLAGLIAGGNILIAVSVMAGLFGGA